MLCRIAGTCPELDHLLALGDTEEEEVRELKVAIDLVLEDMAATGATPPPPAIHAAHSGQFRVRRRTPGHVAPVAVDLNQLYRDLLPDRRPRRTASPPSR